MPELTAALLRNHMSRPASASMPLPYPEFRKKDSSKWDWPTQLICRSAGLQLKRQLEKLCRLRAAKREELDQ